MWDRILSILANYEIRDNKIFRPNHDRRTNCKSSEDKRTKNSGEKRTSAEKRMLETCKAFNRRSIMRITINKVGKVNQEWKIAKGKAMEGRPWLRVGKEHRWDIIHLQEIILARLAESARTSANSFFLFSLYLSLFLLYSAIGKNHSEPFERKEGFLARSFSEKSPGTKKLQQSEEKSRGFRTSRPILLLIILHWVNYLLFLMHDRMKETVWPCKTLFDDL